MEKRVAQDIILQEKFKPSIQESLHPYRSAPGAMLTGSVKYEGASMLVLTFDDRCQTSRGNDVLTLMDSTGRTLAVRSGQLTTDWNTKLRISDSEVRWTFTSSGKGGLWGFKFTVTPVPPAEEIGIEFLRDICLLEKPSLALVKRLLSKITVIGSIRK